MRGTGRRERRSSQRRAQRLTARTWVLMGGAVLVLVAILVALLFFSGSGEGDGGRLPNVGDHWHSSYSITLCGETEPPFVASPGNIHTHGDGLFHIHPTRRGEGGLNANLARLMSSTGSRLTDDSIETVSGAKIHQRRPVSGPAARPGVSQGQRHNLARHRLLRAQGRRRDRAWLWAAVAPRIALPDSTGPALKLTVRDACSRIKPRPCYTGS